MKIIKTANVKQAAGARMSRLLQHMTNGSFGIVSGHDGTLNVPPAGQTGRAENNRSQRSLIQKVRDAGLSFIDMAGAWSESASLTEAKKYFPEDSIFIINPPSEEFVRSLAAGDRAAGQKPQFAYVYGQNGRWAVKQTSDGSVIMGKTEKGDEAPLAGESVMDDMDVDANPLKPSPEGKGRLVHDPLGDSERSPAVYTKHKNQRFWFRPQPETDLGKFPPLGPKI